MNIKLKIFFEEWLFLVLLWIVFMNMGTLFYIGVEDYLCLGEWEEYASSWFAYFENTIFGFIFGTLFALINRISDFRFFRRLSFGRMILFRSFLYLLAFLFTGSFSTFLYYLLGAFDGKTWQQIADMFSPEVFTIGLLFMGILVIFTNFLLQVNKKFGMGAMWKMVIGTYHKPKDELRIFMFLDLKGSTSIAERMGHNLYSRLIQDCFHELTDIVIAHKAEIYQYVGDEVVLTWKVKDGLDKLNCIQFYFKYCQRLLDRKSYFMNKYQVQPEFKAGMEMGTVTVAEVGEIKREIAYHGDVLNTAARVQGKCNEYGKQVLIAESLEEALRDAKGIRIESMGEELLRGKKEKVKIFSVEEEGKVVEV